jgi:hypothetical protein
MFRNLSSILYLPISSHLSGCRYISLSKRIVLTIYRLPPSRQFGKARTTLRVELPLPFRFPTMPPPWALTSLTRLRPGIKARTLWRQTYASTTHGLPRKYSRAFSETNSESNSRVFADPERPDLFYHLLEPPSAVSATNHVFGLSFLNALKSKDDVRSPRIIGYLPASEGGRVIEAGLNDFRENRRSTTDLGGRTLLMVSPGSWVQGNSA